MARGGEGSNLGKYEREQGTEGRRDGGERGGYQPERERHIDVEG